MSSKKIFTITLYRKIKYDVKIEEKRKEATRVGEMRKKNFMNNYA